MYFLVYNTWFWITAESAEGTVVGWDYMEVRPGGRKIGEERTKDSLIMFKDSSGDEIFFSTDVGSRSGLYTKGEKVTVLYKKQDQQNAMVRDFKSMYLGPLMLLPFGAVFGVVGVLVKSICGGATIEKEPKAERLANAPSQLWRTDLCDRRGGGGRCGVLRLVLAGTEARGWQCVKNSGTQHVTICYFSTPNAS